MKWLVAPLVMVLITLVLFVFVAMNVSMLRRAQDTMEHSIDSFIAVIRPVMNQAVDEARGRVGHRQPDSFQPDVSGIARVLDGDTIEIGSVRVRLWGVDAPEGRQSCVAQGRRWPCGRQATQALAGRINGRSVSCEERDRDGRIIAVCRHGGRDVSAWLVREGWALAFRRYTRAYVEEEAKAQAAQRGLWQGEFVPPWDWRRGKRLEAAGRDARTVTASDRGDCRIKSNISRNSGRRLYHVPGDPEYAKTRISTSHGERWFCSEAAAQAAGWSRTPSRNRSERRKTSSQDSRSSSTRDRSKRLGTSSRDTRATSTRDRGACKIKGNISRGSGRRLYHIPGDPDYARTRISSSHGERWFCSESEARAAGWKRSGR